MEVLDSENKEFNSGLKWLAVLRIVFVATTLISIVLNNVERFVIIVTEMHRDGITSNSNNTILLLVPVAILLLIFAYNIRQYRYEMSKVKLLRSTKFRWLHMIILILFVGRGSYELIKSIKGELIIFNSSSHIFHDVFFILTVLISLFILIIELLIYFEVGKFK